VSSFARAFRCYKTATTGSKVVQTHNEGDNDLEITSKNGYFKKIKILDQSHTMKIVSRYIKGQFAKFGYHLFHAFDLEASTNYGWPVTGQP